MRLMFGMQDDPNRTYCLLASCVLLTTHLLTLLHTTATAYDQKLLLGSTYYSTCHLLRTDLLSVLPSTTTTTMRYLCITN